MKSARTSRVSPLVPASASRHTGARPSRLAQIHKSAAQKVSKPLGSNAYRPKTCKSRDKSEHTGPANASCPVKFKAADALKSP
jgi:hypothetical protein